MDELIFISVVRRPVEEVALSNVYRQQRKRRKNKKTFSEDNFNLRRERDISIVLTLLNEDGYLILKNQMVLEKSSEITDYLINSGYNWVKEIIVKTTQQRIKDGRKKSDSNEAG